MDINLVDISHKSRSLTRFSHALHNFLELVHFSFKGKKNYELEIVNKKHCMKCSQKCSLSIALHRTPLEFIIINSKQSFFKIRGVSNFSTVLYMAHINGTVYIKRNLLIFPIWTLFQACRPSDIEHLMYRVIQKFGNHNSKRFYFDP